ncbi:zinc-ribbon domain-containing protein [Thermoproteota archaeon]
MISGKKVYLDIDDYSRTDSYDRLVCVVYVDQGSRLLNVNKALLVSGDAEIWDHHNEFNPYSWNLYESSRGFGAIFELLPFVVILLILLDLRRRSRSKIIKKTSKPKLCPNCRWANKADSVFCGYCGHRFEK